jgi:rhodanese-related sulfurtransferase
MKKQFKLLVAAAGIAALALLSSCGSSKETTTVDYSNATVIDVRAIEEFDAGHLLGAVNHNVEDGSLEAALETLDPAGNYVVYCRSGRRSAIAVELMKSKGFTQITDLGSLEDASQTSGIAIVTD